MCIRDRVKCETPTIEECLNLINEKAKEIPSGDWITGQGWNQNTWGCFGSSTQLDSVSGDHPVFLADKSIHAAWVNSLAFRIAHIDKNTPDPIGGTIQRDSEGNPTGILFENAVNLVERLIPPISRSQRLSLMLKGQQNLHRLGLTGIHDFDRSDCFFTLQQMQQADQLTLRVTKGIPVGDLNSAISLGLRAGFGNCHLHLGPVKLFADGALGPQTAAMFAPYERTDDHRGTLLLKADDVFETGMLATSNGWSLAIHAIGDKAVNEVLNGLAMIRQFEIANQLPGRYHRIEHLQVIHPDDIQKVKDTGIVASMQPTHVLSDMFTADKYWGIRSRYAYAFASLSKKGVPLIFGSDAPVESPNPFIGICAAVTRRRENGEPGPGGWYPDERISIAQARRSFSEIPARISGYGNTYGSIKNGNAADFIILPQNPEIVLAPELMSIQPVQVFVDGKSVFEF
jgi:predicted amidohydrolase YtcJ